MKKLLITLCLFFTAIGISAQTTIDNDFFTMTAPTEWQCIDMPQYTDTLGRTQCTTLLQMVNNVPVNMGFVCAFEKKFDLHFLIGESQMNSKFKNLPKDAEVELGKPYSTTFLGNEALARDFKVKEDGTTIHMVIYGFHVSNFSANVVEMSLTGTKPDFSKVWQSITWKEYVKKAEPTDPFEEELRSTLSAVDKMVKSTVIGDGQKLEGFDIDTSSKSIAYKIRFTDMAISDWKKDDLGKMREGYEQELGPALMNNLVESMDILKRANSKGYTLKIVVLDKNGDHLMGYTIKPAK